FHYYASALHEVAVGEMKRLPGQQLLNFGSQGLQVWLGCRHESSPHPRDQGSFVPVSRDVVARKLVGPQDAAPGARQWPDRPQVEHDLLRGWAGSRTTLELRELIGAWKRMDRPGHKGKPAVPDQQQRGPAHKGEAGVQDVPAAVVKGGGFGAGRTLVE